MPPGVGPAVSAHAKKRRVPRRRTRKEVCSSVVFSASMLHPKGKRDRCPPPAPRAVSGWVEARRFLVNCRENRPMVVYRPYDCLRCISIVTVGCVPRQALCASDRGPVARGEVIKACGNPPTLATVPRAERFHIMFVARRVQLWQRINPHSVAGLMDNNNHVLRGGIELTPPCVNAAGWRHCNGELRQYKQSLRSRFSSAPDIIFRM